MVIATSNTVAQIAVGEIFYVSGEFLRRFLGSRKYAYGIRH